MVGEFEKLAYEAALRGLDKQEALLEELRSRTGVLLAASRSPRPFWGSRHSRIQAPEGWRLPPSSRS